MFKKVDIYLLRDVIEYFWLKIDIRLKAGCVINRTIRFRNLVVWILILILVFEL